MQTVQAMGAYRARVHGTINIAVSIAASNADSWDDIMGHVVQTLINKAPELMACTVAVFGDGFMGNVEVVKRGRWYYWEAYYKEFAEVSGVIPVVK